MKTIDELIGIHFGMPEEEYHAIPAFSQSLLKQYRVSMYQGWWSTPWLNPSYEDYYDKPESSAMDFGSAMHAYILEGESFLDRFTVKPDVTDYPEALKSTDDLKDYMRKHEIKPLTGNKPQLIERIRAAEHDVEIFDEILSEHAKANAGKTFIDKKTMDCLKLGFALYKAQPLVAKKFTDQGYSEVSIVWRDKKTGLPLKTRIDRLELESIIDLKTFSNIYGRKFDRAVNKALENSTYNYQALMNQVGVKEAVALYQKDANKYVHGGVDKDWMKALCERKKRRYYFLFIESKLPCEMRLKEFVKSSSHAPNQEQLFHLAAREEIRDLLDRIAINQKKYTNSPWVSADIESEILEEEVPYWGV